MALLFEYGKWETISNIKGLKFLLKDIWQQSIFHTEAEFDEQENDNRYQPFLRIEVNQVRANNFVGFIQNGEEVIEIYPKVFRQNPEFRKRKELMLQHIFYWFSYCRKWRFPFNKVSLDTFDVKSFPELIINLIASQFYELVSKQPLTMYQAIEESMQTPRGAINFKRYINKSLSNGNYQNIECDYEPFLFDNIVNRIIKYCSRLLMQQTKFSENLKILQDVIFILDEVDDLPCTIHDLDKVSINSYFDEYSIVMDSCKLILSQQLYSNHNYDLSQWCLLFPMEYIFEDFLAGFLQEKFQKEWKVEYQKSNEYLSNNPRVFNMQHDIYLTSKNESKRKIIIDTKYKIRDENFKADPKKGVSQTDLYQMVSYAFKRGCTDLILTYPNLSDNINEIDKFEIISGFEGKEKINVIAMEIPFWSLTDLKGLDKKIYEIMELNLHKVLN